MKLDTRCPWCHTHFTARAHSLGRWTTCLHCSRTFKVKELRR